MSLERLKRALQQRQIEPCWHDALGPLCAESCPQRQQIGPIPIGGKLGMIQTICKQTGFDVADETFCRPAVAELYARVRGDDDEIEAVPT